MNSRLIAVGVDESSSSQAVRWASRQAVAWHAPLEFVHALPAPLPDSSEADDISRWQQGERVVRDASALARTCGADERRTSIHDQPVAGALVTVSQRAGLLVIGKRDRSVGLRRRSASVSRHLSRYSACPVVVVPDTTPGAPTHRIVLLLNGIAADRAAMSFAFEQASVTGAEIQAIHAWRETDVGPPVSSSLLEDGLAERLRDSALLMAEELAGYQALDPDVRVTRVSAPGIPDRILVSAADEADLLVLAAQAPVDDILRTAEAELSALRHARCPVVYAR